jgi:hypothetical protein
MLAQHQTQRLEYFLDRLVELGFGWVFRLNRTHD